MKLNGNIKILNLSTFDTDGAGSYAIQMNKLLQDLGFTSKLIVRYASASERSIIPVDYIPRKGSFAFFQKKINRWFRKRSNHVGKKRIKTHFKYYFFQDEHDEYTSAKQILHHVHFTPDVILLYWISEFITSKTIKELHEITGARIYWLMMDNAPITGGCHYPWDCNGYKRYCENCPAIIEEESNKKAFDNLSIKHVNLPISLTFIAGSEQDYKRAEDATVCKNRNILKILGLVDENKFKPFDKIQAKEHFGISSNLKVIFFGATKLTEKRKGIDLLINSFSQLKDYLKMNNIILLYAGPQMIDLSDYSYTYAGYLKENELILAYQAADVFICPSVEDSGPIMINQSLMCGTPVISFNMGAATDLVKDGLTGYLAKNKNPEELVAGIKMIFSLTDCEYSILSQNCRDIALKNFSTHKITNDIRTIIMSTISKT